MLGGAALELKIAILQYRCAKVQRTPAQWWIKRRGFWRRGTIKVFVIHRFAAPPCGRVAGCRLFTYPRVRVLGYFEIACSRITEESKKPSPGLRPTTASTTGIIPNPFPL